jgi:AraC family transcriptional regulator
MRTVTSMTTPPRTPPAHIPWTERMLDTLEFIQQHLDEPLDPHELAGRTHFSPHHFHRVFRGMVGESVMEHVRRLRLERAAFRLKYGESPVTQIAFQSGYDSHEAFTRAFRARFGAAPSEWRAQAIADDATFTVRDEPARRCLTLRHVGAYGDLSGVWTTLMGYAVQHQLVRSVPQTYGLVYDDPEITAPTHCRYDAALRIGDTALPAPLPPGFAVRELAAGRWACTTHHGSFDTVLESYVRLLGTALPRAGVELADDPVVEVSLTDPRITPPHELRTEICVRLA